MFETQVLIMHGHLKRPTIHGGKVERSISCDPVSWLPLSETTASMVIPQILSGRSRYLPHPPVCNGLFKVVVRLCESLKTLSMSTEYIGLGDGPTRVLGSKLIGLGISGPYSDIQAAMSSRGTKF